MLLEYLYPYSEFFSGLNVLKYITFRSFGALITSMIVFFILGQPWIRFLKKRQFGQAIRDCGPESHQEKKGTPTMGGVLVMFSVLLAIGLWGNLSNEYVWACVFVFVTMGLIGFIDDYRKVITKDPKGFPGRYKIILEVLICLIGALWLYEELGLETRLYFPLAKGLTLELGAYYLVLAVLVVVGCANAVNLTDGLDGLVAVPSMTSFLTFGFFVYVVGHAVLADYLQFPFVKGAGEVTIVCAAVVGACLGFLWYNTYPAEIFMGDVGSLSLGGLLGFVALIAKQELLLMLIGGLFVLETLSVITQVLSFKMTGKRIFRMAPLHHHYELKGLSEPKIIVRFWIISIVLALLAMATLKLR